MTRAVRINQLLLRRLGGGRSDGGSLYDRALTLGHSGDLAGMRALMARFLVTAGPDEDPEKVFRALMELRRYETAFAAAEKLLVPGRDRLTVKDPFIDIRFSPPADYYAGHLRSLAALRPAGAAARWRGYYAGVLLRRMNRLPEALRAFDAAGAGGRYAWMRFQRGWTVLNLGGYIGEAAADLRAAVK